MILAGNNILRFVKMATAKKSQIDLNAMWLYKFTADSLRGEHIDFIFQVTPFGDLPLIIQDLIKLTKTKEWCDVQLVETSSTRMLMIKSIKQILNQEEMNERSRIERITIK